MPAACGAAGLRRARVWDARAALHDAGERRGKRRDEGRGAGWVHEELVTMPDDRSRAPYHSDVPPPTPLLQSSAVGRLRHSLYSWEGPAYWNAHPGAESATLKPEPPHERMTRHFYAVQVRPLVDDGRGDRQCRLHFRLGWDTGSSPPIIVDDTGLRCWPSERLAWNPALWAGRRLWLLLGDDAGPLPSCSLQAGNGVLKIGGDRVRLPLGSTTGLPLLEVRHVPRIDAALL